MTDLTIIIPVKNDARRLGHCLDALAKNFSNGDRPEVIVADNGSTDDSPLVASRAGARVLVLPNLRVSELRNAAAAAATTRLLAFVDADHEVSATWVNAATDALSPAGVGAAGALYTSPPAGTWVQRMYGELRGHTKGQGEAAWLGSGNLVARREAFDQVHGFDVSLEACEDVDFCQRLRAAGWKIIGDERLKSIHLGDPPTLGALFRAERWRGRDNLRVSLRGPLSLHELPSILAPVLTLVALAAILASPLTMLVGVSPLWVAAPAAAVIVVLAGLKALRMATRAGSADAGFLARALAVALTYDAARAVALITAAPHHRVAQQTIAHTPTR